MTEGFDENVPQKMPGTRSQRTPLRPWDVKPAAQTGVESPKEAPETRSQPLKSVNTKEDTKRRVKEILRELTEQSESPAVIAEPPVRHERPVEPAKPEVMTATDNSMLIEEESNDVLAEIDTLEAELESTLSMQNKVEEELGRLREEYDELLNAKEELEARIETLKTVEELESNLKAAEEENRMATERMGEIEFRLHETEEKAESLHGELARASAHLQETAREKEKLVRALQQSTEEIELYQEEVRSLQEQNSGAQNSIAELKEECSLLGRDLETLKGEKAEADSAVESLQAELIEERQKTKYLESSVENYAVVKATLESDLTAARSALKAIRERLGRANLRFKKSEGEE